MGELISLCIPCMNRTYDLKWSLSYTIRAANGSPPVEIVVLNYNSTDGLDEYMRTVGGMGEGVSLTYARYPVNCRYNSAHARNLTVVAAHGEYIAMLATDIAPLPTFVQTIRALIEAERPVWMCEGQSGRLIVCQRAEFMAAGGYDERFRFYGPEDRDICDRLHRRGGSFCTFSPRLVQEIYTPDEEKLRNLDLEPFAGAQLVKREMSKRMRAVYDENTRVGALVANPDGWGHGPLDIDTRAK